MKFTSFLSFALALLSISARATDYYVCASCSNANDGNAGTQSSPFRSIQRGIDRVGPGETVFIMNGVYELGSNDWEPVARISKAGTPRAWITIRNFPGHAPVLRASASVGKWSLIKIHPTYNSVPSYLIIDGLTIQGNRTSYTLEDAKRLSARCGSNPDVSAKANGQGINIVGPGYCYDSDVSGVAKDKIPHHIVIRNCKVYDCTSSGIAAFRSDEIILENNEVFNNCWYTTYGTSGINFYQSRNWSGAATEDPLTTQAHRIIIRNNRVYGNGTLVKPSTTNCIRYDGNGIIIDDNRNDQPGDGCNVATNKPYTGRTLIMNNVVYGNGGSGIHLFSSQYIDVYNNTLYKNSVVNNSQEVYYRKCAFGRIKNNIFYSADFPGKKANAILAGDIEYDYNLHFSTNPDNGKLAYKGNGSTETHNIEVDPRFVLAPAISSDTNTIWTNMPTPATAVNFSLRAISAAIDNGTSISAVTQDLLGNPRTEVDRGAYEFQTGAVAIDNIVPDFAFRSHLIALGKDANGDGSIQAAEVAAIDTLVLKDRYNIRNLNGIQAFTNLVYLDCAKNRITQLDSIKASTKLRYLDCSNNQIVRLDLTPNTLLERIYAYNNQLSTFLVAKERNTRLRTLILSSNQLTSLRLTNFVSLDKLYAYNNPLLYAICVPDVAKAQSNSNFKKDAEAIWTNDCPPPVDPSNIIPDPNFRKALIALGLDANGDSSIQRDEVQGVDTLVVSGKNIASLRGIQAFSQLRYLDCSDNQLANLDSLKRLPLLTYLDFANNGLTSLDLFPNPLLEKVFGYNNRLTSFKISKEKNTILRTLVISNNQLAVLNLRTSTYLDKLLCHNNPFLNEICVADVNKAQTNANFKKDAFATWTANCAAALREETQEEAPVEVRGAWQVFPNPASETVYIEGPSREWVVSVKDARGIERLRMANVSSLDISQLPKGCYFVEIRSEENSENRQLMVY